MEELQQSQPDNDISEKLQKTLDDYGEVLKKCTEAMETNTNKNNAKIEEIRVLVKEIKEKIMNANNKLITINENRKEFDEATQKKQNQLRLAIEEAREKNKQEMDKLQNELLQEQEENKKKLQKIKEDTENVLIAKEQELNQKHKEELNDKLRELSERDKEERNKELDEQKRLSEEKITLLQEEKRKQEEKNSEDMKLKLNQLEESKKSLEDTNSKLAEINEKQISSEAKIVELDAIINDLKLKLDNKIQESKSRIEEFANDKDRLISEHNASMTELTNTHNTTITELNKKHQDEMEKKERDLQAEFENMLVAAKKEAVEEVRTAIEQEAELKVQSSNDKSANLSTQLKQCNEDKEKFAQQLLEAQKTVDLLKKEYRNGEEEALNKLEREVKEIPISELEKQLEMEANTIREIDEKQLEKEANTIRDADDILDESKRVAGTNRYSDNESDNDDDKGDNDDDKGEWVEAIDKDSGTTYYYNTLTRESRWDKPEEMEGKPKVDETRESEVSGDLHPLEIDKTVKENALRKLRLLIKAKRAFNESKDKMNFKNMLVGRGDNKGVIDAYTRRITHGELDKLIERIVDSKLHGMGKSASDKFKTEINAVIDKSTKHHKQHHILMKRMLESMVMRDSTYYQNIANEIDRVGFEKTFEQLLTAFHLAWGVKGIADLYRFGHNSSADHPYKDRDLQLVGKVAMKLWATPFHEYGEVKLMDEARDHIKKDKSDEYAYYHKHDHRKEQVKEAWAGGFRHGKRSKKQNKRSLKSKLMAKKFSLKSKKKGKNKSKKRRKSIKIRIN